MSGRHLLSRFTACGATGRRKSPVRPPAGFGVVAVIVDEAEATSMVGRNAPRAVRLGVRRWRPTRRSARTGVGAIVAARDADEAI